MVNCKLWLFFRFRREQQQQQEEASWEELKAEEAYRERMRERDAANRSKKPIVWDDADERKCQQKYRKKYSAHWMDIFFTFLR